MIFDCELQRLLGSGGAARVFQAIESDVGDRMVALKFSADDGAEPHIQGKLEHPHIVPILWARPMDTETGLRALCMPFREGVTLDRLLERLRRDPSRPRRTARDFWQLFRDTQGNADSALPEVPEDWNGFPTQGSFAQAVAWLGQKLAEALAHAHRRQTVHRDLKPANILMAVNGGPMLLDFNLAHHPHTPERAENAMRGGTLPYMAPEQIAAFLDDRLWERVGPRSDLFALGLLLRELLTRQSPQGPSPDLSRPRAVNEMFDLRSKPLPKLRVIDRTIPRSLERIIDRCTAFRAEDRYPDADELARDLARFMDRTSAKVSSRGVISTARLLSWPFAISLVLSVVVLARWNEAGRSLSPEGSQNVELSEDDGSVPLDVWTQVIAATGHLKFDESGVNRTQRQMLTSVQRAVQTAASAQPESQFLQALHCVVGSMSGPSIPIPAGISLKEIKTSEILREPGIGTRPDLGKQLAKFAHGQLKERFEEDDKELRDRRLNTAALAVLLALSVDPNSPSAMLEWGVCEFYRRNRGDAIQVFRQCLLLLNKPDADDIVIRSACHYWIAVCFQEGIDRQVLDRDYDPPTIVQAELELGLYALQHVDRALVELRDWPSAEVDRDDSQFSSATKSYWAGRKSIQDLRAKYLYRSDQSDKALQIRIDDVVNGMPWMADIPGFQTDPSAMVLDELRNEIQRCRLLVDTATRKISRRNELLVVLDKAQEVVEAHEKATPQSVTTPR